MPSGVQCYINIPFISTYILVFFAEKQTKYWDLYCAVVDEEAWSCRTTVSNWTSSMFSNQCECVNYNNLQTT